jgi:hypothetical protein
MCVVILGISIALTLLRLCGPATPTTQLRVVKPEPVSLLRN